LPPSAPVALTRAAVRQTLHHLFPSVHPCHYPALAVLVRRQPGATPPFRLRIAAMAATLLCTSIRHGSQWQSVAVWDRGVAPWLRCVWTIVSGPLLESLTGKREYFFERVVPISPNGWLTRFVRGWPKLWPTLGLQYGFSVKVLGQVSQFGPTLCNFRVGAAGVREARAADGGVDPRLRGRPRQPRPAPPKVELAAGESVIKCPSPLNVRKVTHDHSCY
jgi:hypothetical protein